MGTLSFFTHQFCILTFANKKNGIIINIFKRLIEQIDFYYVLICKTLELKKGIASMLS